MPASSSPVNPSPVAIKRFPWMRRLLNIVLEYKELAMFWALHVEGCQQAAPVDDDVSRILTEARDCALAFDIGPQAEAVVGKKREQSGKFGTDE